MSKKIIHITDCDELIKYINPVHQHDFMRTPSFFTIGSYDDELLVINFDDISHSKSFFTHLDNERIYSIEFWNCQFDKNLDLNEPDCAKYYEKANFTFIDCVFKNLAIDEFTYNGKIKFKKCKFKIKQIFYNTVFNGYVEFFDCEFEKKLIFNKVEFREAVVFTKSIFHDNVLFTYTQFNSLGVFSRTLFKKGLDLSQAIINKNLTFFETQIKNYHSEAISINDEKIFESGKSRKKFDISVTGSGNIPTINKRETFRIIKNQLEKEGNNIDAFKYNSLEKHAYQQQLKEHNKKWFNSQDALMFALNNLSNKHKNSWLSGFGFTVIVAIILLILTFGTTREFWNRVCWDCEFDLNVIGYTIKQFINFLNPEHSINYIDELNPFYGIPYVFDFLGRIAVGYGIYQTVQAFRKFR